MKLLSPGSTNAKTNKNNIDIRYHSAILHLAPYNLSGYQVCKGASKGCSKACLNSAGRGRFDNVQQARIRKTKLLFENQQLFMKQLIDDIGLLVYQANKVNKQAIIRLNGTSDIAWEKIKIANFCNVFEYWPQVFFYDYTKRIDRITWFVKEKPDNYHLTFSANESNSKVCKLASDKGINVAVVFRNKLPNKYFNKPVINGDTTDLRFLDNKGVIVGLTAKGKAKTDKSGFVKDI